MSPSQQQRSTRRGAERRALVVVGKAPIPGQVKTRLCPPLDPATAAALHTAFLRDTLALATAVSETTVLILYVPTDAAVATLTAAVGATIRLLPQQGAGLTAALSGAAATLLGEGFTQVALISSDNPSLPPAYVAGAFAALDHHDVALGPAEDGGYYLIALKAPHQGLFERISWSTAVVYEQTLERAAELGLSVATMPTWYDVDEVAALERLYREVSATATHTAAHTRALLLATYPAGLTLALAQ